MVIRKRTKRLSTILAATIYAPFALGLGLGEITINSNLNQPLDAEIKITSATQEELSQLVLNVPGNDIFARYDIERSKVLSNLRFMIKEKNDGSQVIHVTSTQVVQDPFLTFLVEANWTQGRILREYTVLVDPPLFIPNQNNATTTQPYIAPAVTSTASQTSIQRDTRIPEQTYPGDSYRQEYSSTTGNEYRVKRGDTLWEIADQFNPDDSFSVNQAMVAIYQTNQNAFDGNINRLKSDTTLTIPNRVTIGRISRDQANQEVRAQTSSWRNSVSRPDTSTAGTSSATSTSSSSSSSANTSEGGTLVLKVPDLDGDFGSGASGSGTTGSDAAGEARIQELQSKVEEFERLLAAKDNELANLQAQLSEQYALGTTDTSLGSIDAADAVADIDSEVIDDGTEQTDGEPDDVTGTSTDTVDSVTTSDETLVDTTVDATVVTPQANKVPVVSAPADEVFDLMGLLKKLGLGSLIALLLGLAGFFGYKKLNKGPSRDSLFVDDDLDLAAESIAEKVKTKIGKKYDANGATSEIEVGETSFEEAGITPPGDSQFPTQVESGSDDLVLDLTGEMPRVISQGTQELEALVDAPSIESDQALPFDDTTLADASSTSSSMQLDQNDPLAETDFHMAYGLYDQAADLMQTAIKDNNNFSFKEKLLEVFFVSGNKEEFVRYAGEIKEEAIAEHAGSWDNIIIMGKQLAPDNELFSGEVASGGIDEGLDFQLDQTGSVNIGNFDIDQSLFGGEEDATETSDLSLDLDANTENDDDDFALDLDSGSVENDDFALDLDVDLGLPETPVESVAAVENLLGDDEALDLDMNFDLPDAPVDLEQAIEGFGMDLDATLNGTQEILAVEESESPLSGWESDSTDAVEIVDLDNIDQSVLDKLSEQSGDATEEVKISDLLDLDIGAATGLSETVEDSDISNLSNLSEELIDTGMDFDMSDLGLAGPAQEDDSDESEQTLDFAFDLDKSDDIDITADAPDFDFSDEADTQSLDAKLTDALGAAGDDSTKEMKIDDNFDLLLDDSVESTSEAALDLDLEQMFADSGDEAFADDTLQNMLPEGVSEDDSGTMQLESILDKDEGVLNPDDNHASTARITDDELAAMGLSDEGPDMMSATGMSFDTGSDIDEVATKLDLARAYIEMDDPDNARGILQEVIDEGNDAQRNEAKDILITLG